MNLIFTTEDDSNGDYIETCDVESRLRKEIKLLLGNPSFQQIKDLDQMTNLLMQKLTQIAQEQDSSSSSDHNCHESAESKYII